MGSQPETQKKHQVSHGNQGKTRWENGKIIGKPLGKWENHRKTRGKPVGKWKKYRKTHRKMEGYPLVNCYIPIANHHFSWVNPLEVAVFNSYIKKLPEGSRDPKLGLLKYLSGGWYSYPSEKYESQLGTNYSQLKGKIENVTTNQS